MFLILAIEGLLPAYWRVIRGSYFLGFAALRRCLFVFSAVRELIHNPKSKSHVALGPLTVKFGGDPVKLRKSEGNARRDTNVNPSSDSHRKARLRDAAWGLSARCMHTTKQDVAKSIDSFPAARDEFRSEQKLVLLQGKIGNVFILTSKISLQAYVFGEVAAGARLPAPE